MNKVDKRLTELEKRINNLHRERINGSTLGWMLDQIRKGEKKDAPAVEDKTRLEKQVDYSIALQRSIEYHCEGNPVPYGIMIQAPHHADMLNQHLNKDDCKPEAKSECKHELEFGTCCSRCGIKLVGGKPETSEQTLEDGKKECGCFCCTQRRSHSNPDKVSISRKVVEEVLRANYVLPNMLHDELKRAMKEGI